MEMMAFLMILNIWFQEVQIFWNNIGLVISQGIFLSVIIF